MSELLSVCTSPIRICLLQQSSTSAMIDMIVLVQTVTFAAIIYQFLHKISSTYSSSMLDMYNFYVFGHSTTWNYISLCISDKAGNTPSSYHLHYWASCLWEKMAAMQRCLQDCFMNQIYESSETKGKGGCDSCSRYRPNESKSTTMGTRHTNMPEELSSHLSITIYSNRKTVKWQWACPRTLAPWKDVTSCVCQVWLLPCLCRLFILPLFHSLHSYP